MTIACQRWRVGRDSFRPAGERFLPGRHEVVVLPEVDAKAFVCRHHYSGSFPAARFRVGLMRAGVGLAGVAVFSVPMNERTIPKHTGVGPREGVELGRFVLLDEVEGNGETWFLARAFALLERELGEVKAVLSCADPMPRPGPEGSSRPGHVGTIYQAHNARYVGRTEGRMLWVTREGRILSPRTLSKLRVGDQGAAGAYEILRRAGAPERQPFEDGAAYVARALAEGPFTRVRHPGNHAYVWAVGRERHRTQLGLARALPFPKGGELA